VKSTLRLLTPDSRLLTFYLECGMALVLLRGGGDLATGVALRLHRAGLKIVVAELRRPLAVRRAVSFAEAIFERQWTVEGVTATRADSLDHALDIVSGGGVPVVVAPALVSLFSPRFEVLVDARLTKRPPETDISAAPLVIGLGPGFTAGQHCHAVVETHRGHTLGRVFWSGSALPDTARPEGDPRRVLRAPADGPLTAFAAIGDAVREGSTVAEVDGEPIVSPLSGVLRGLIRPGAVVSRGTKVGDVDPRGIREHCFLVSDKALAIGGGVLEAILSRPDVRTRLYA
jgi:xanthine dehydrogenase accessory factor